MAAARRGSSSGARALLPRNDGMRASSNRPMYLQWPRQDDLNGSNKTSRRGGGEGDRQDLGVSGVQGTRVVDCDEAMVSGVTDAIANCTGDDTEREVSVTRWIWMKYASVGKITAG